MAATPPRCCWPMESAFTRLLPTTAADDDAAAGPSVLTAITEAYFLLLLYGAEVDHVTDRATEGLSLEEDTLG